MQPYFLVVANYTSAKVKISVNYRMQRLKELTTKTLSAETSVNNNSQYATHDAKEVFHEGAHDTKEGSHDTKEGSHDAKEGSHDTKEGSCDAKEGSYDTKESSHDSCGPTAVVITVDNTEAQSEDKRNNVQENRTHNEEQDTTDGNVDGQEAIHSEEVENDGQDSSPSTPLPAVSNAIGSGLYIVGMHRKMVSS